MRYFYIKRPEISDPISVITGPDAKHIKTVLRLKPGDKIGLFDGEGLQYEAKIVALSTGRVEVSIIHGFPSTTESPIQIIVAQAFLKERKMDGLVRQLTELGITKWIPFIAERSVPRPDKKHLSARVERWKKIAKEALKQCKRGRIMEIGAIASFEEVLNFSDMCDLKIVFWENELKPINDALPKHDRQYNIIFTMIGPEGGFTSREIDSARARGFVTSSLGPRILRSETATIAACVMLQYFYGDMG